MGMKKGRFGNLALPCGLGVTPDQEDRDRGEGLIGGDGMKAVITDVDGTLYRQGLVRRWMVSRLVRAHFKRPAAALRVFRILRAYRHTQEHLREAVRAGPAGDVAELQLRLASQQTGYDLASVRACVERWMEIEPLDLLARAAYPDLLEFLDFVHRRGVLLGAFSDYPAARKLEAMGIRNRFSAVVSAQDADVQEFKPSPRGLQVALTRMGVEPADAVYIGDRPELDAAAAWRAGVRCVIIGESGSGRQDEWVGMRTYRDLITHLFPSVSDAESAA